MRNWFAAAAVGFAAMLPISSMALAQTAQSQSTEANETRSSWKYYPKEAVRYSHIMGMRRAFRRQ
jgi:hypothetical protein